MAGEMGARRKRWVEKLGMGFVECRLRKRALSKAVIVCVINDRAAAPGVLSAGGGRKGLRTGLALA